MATQDMAFSEAWVKLVDLESDEREARMLEHYKELAALSEEERKSRMVQMANLVYDLPDQALRELTMSRLRVWLNMEPDMARLIASSYDAAMKEISGPKAMRRVAFVQRLSREFSYEDQERLVALVPSVFAGAPTAASIAAQSQPAPRPEQPAKPKRSWWPFGSR